MHLATLIFEKHKKTKQNNATSTIKPSTNLSKLRKRLKIKIHVHNTENDNTRGKRRLLATEPRAPAGPGWRLVAV